VPGLDERTTAKKMVRCRVGIKLTAEEITRLEALPTGANMIVPERWCALESGHAGSHFALGQASGDEEFWIQWVEGDSQIVVLEPCPSEGPEGSEDPCLLYSRHDGCHDFGWSADTAR
jgi:hypothetical protein